MRILLHTDCINERGVSASVYEYAKNLNLLGHEVAWYFPKNSDGNVISAINRFNCEITLTPYGNFSKVSDDAKRNFDLAYFQKAGHLDEHLIPGVRNVVHVVFNVLQRHGDNYAYISKWLSRAATKSRNEKVRSLRRRIPNPFTTLDYVPYCLDLPLHEQNAREELLIPSDAFVIVNVGGRTSFDIPWVKQIICQLIEEEANFWFVGVNIEKFTNHPRALFIPTILGKSEKVRILNTANLFLHARTLGESFGMAILEAMRVGVPILSWAGGNDRNHRELLDKRCLYRNARQLRELILNVKREGMVTATKHNKDTSLQYLASNVMPRFCKVFGIK